MPGYFSTPSQMPGALIEPLFITDPFEGTIAASATGQQAIATGLAQAVAQYFAPPPAPRPPDREPALDRRQPAKRHAAGHAVPQPTLRDEAMSISYHRRHPD